MTPNGAIVFATLTIGAAILSGRLATLAVPLALCAVFAIVEVRDRIVAALIWPAGIVAPLAVFMALVWIGVVGRSPAEIAAGVPGSRLAAFAHVAVICVRLFVIALTIQLLVLRFSHVTPLQFIRATRLPLVFKKLLVLTLSFIDTILNAVERARTALITAGVIAPRLSLQNAANGWILIQTVWLSVITIAIGRARDKWPAENTLARLEDALHAPPQGFGRSDITWIAAAAAALVIVASG